MLRLVVFGVSFVAFFLLPPASPCSAACSFVVSLSPVLSKRQNEYNLVIRLEVPTLFSFDGGSVHVFRFSVLELLG